MTFFGDFFCWIEASNLSFLCVPQWDNITVKVKVSDIKRYLTAQAGMFLINTQKSIFISLSHVPVGSS